MPSVLSDGLTIHYETFGAGGPPVLLLHGFASHHRVNWVETGWTRTLTEAGFTVFALDNRGHGQSDKPYDPALYHPRLMAHDGAAVLLERVAGPAAVIGFSMGARIAAWLAIDRPELVRAVVFGGMGSAMFGAMPNSQIVLAALEAPDLAAVEHPVGRFYRSFAERTGGDLRALAACWRASRDPVPEDELRLLEAPALVVVGELDTVAGDAAGLAKVLPQAESVTIAGRDHMRTTGDPAFKAATLDFLARLPR